MVIGWLNPWKRPRPRPDIRILVYTRPGCHLCDVAWELLADFQKRYEFTLESTNIDTDENLKTQHNDWVPVVEINGRVRFRGHVNRVLLERILNSTAES